MNLFKILLAKLGLLELVWLQDSDGDLTLSIKRKHPFGGTMAYRFWVISKAVRLKEDGTCSGQSYVRHWKPYVS